MGSDRGRRVRALVGQWSTEFGVHFALAYASLSRGWSLRWKDGPTVGQVRARWPAEFGEVEVDRQLSVRAHAAGAVDLALGGETRRGKGRCGDVEALLAERGDLVGGVSARTAALAGALVDAFGPARAEHSESSMDAEPVCGLVAARGLAWLLVEPGQATAQTPAALVMTAREVLTARYATGEAARAWRWELATMPARAAVQAAHGDAGADREVGLAVLSQLRELRREHEELENAALTRAHDRGASWTAIGAALGVTRQSAHERGRRRAEGTPSRSSGQP